MDPNELKRRFDEVDRPRNLILFVGLALLYWAAIARDKATKGSPAADTDLVSIGLAAGLIALLIGLIVSIYRAKRKVMMELGMRCDQCGYLVPPGCAFSDLETPACTRCGHVRWMVPFDSRN
jgi:hypothetical protein